MTIVSDVVVARIGETVVVSPEWGIPTYKEIVDVRAIKNEATREDKSLSETVKAILDGATAVALPDGTVLFTVQTAQGSAKPDIPRLREVLAGFGLNLDDFMVTPEPTSRLVPAKSIPTIPNPR
jgi:hypothetical protein